MEIRTANVAAAKGFKWQKSYSEHSGGTGDRHQDYANYAELLPSLEK